METAQHIPKDSWDTNTELQQEGDGEETQKALYANAQDLTRELEWLAEVLQLKLQLFSGADSTYRHLLEITPPPLEGESFYMNLLRHYECTVAERLALLLALSPHIYPILPQRFFKALEASAEAPEHLHRNYCPTGEALAFLLAEDDLEGRFRLQALFRADHFFSLHRILRLEAPVEGASSLSGLLTPGDEYLDYFTMGTRSLPDFGPDFPAKRMTTALEWEDLVLPANTMKHLEEIRLWTAYGDRLLYEWKLHKKLRPGYRALFYGPPGTGKSMTASLIGKSCGKPVYKVDLSMIVSKYIGETTKNLAKIFAQAEQRDWMLFFDEADALFGKRTQVEDAHDRYANQEVAYLLQRIEHYEGIVLLASNLRENLDSAFTRRFETMIHFPMPDVAERLRLWQQGFAPVSTLADDVVLEDIAEAHVLSGGAIMNVVRYSSLMALHRNTRIISLKDIREGIKKEFKKEGKTI